jgi:hypothetical protein
MMWVSSKMNGNKQERKWLVIEWKTIKWANVNSAAPKGSPWWHHFHGYNGCKTK